MNEQKSIINYEDFSKIDIRVGIIQICERVEKSDKLFKLSVNFGDLGTRQILTGLAQFFTCEEMTGLKTLFVLNLEPRKMMGLESQGMILGIGLDPTKKPTLVKLDDTVQPGDGVS